MMKKSWVILANSAIAKIYEIEKNSQYKKKVLIPIKTLENPEGRLHNKELETDKPGSATNSPGAAQGQRALTKEVSAHEHVVSQFVKEICNFLDKARSLNQFQSLILMAEPKFLGLLRKDLSESTRNLVTSFFNKDLTRETDESIIQFITQEEKKQQAMSELR